MRPLLDTALAALRALPITYGDVRAVSREKEWLQLRDDEITLSTHTVDRGFAVRVLADGAWGWAAAPLPSPEATRATLLAVVDRALDTARAAARARHAPVAFAPAPPQRGTWRTPCERDAFDVPYTEKLDHLFDVTARLRAVPGVSVARAGMVALRTRTWLASTEGTDLDQTLHVTGGGCGAIATRGNVFQRRSYPKDFEGNVAGGGWERVLALDLPGHAPRIGAEAVALLDAPPVPAGRHTLILDGAQLSLQVHESMGHPSELDRVLGEEISLAGASFLTPDRLAEGFQYGSPRVNLYADATTPGGAGTFGWDDEGTPAGRWDLVRDGRFVGYLGSRETTERLRAQGHTTVPGAVRADGWSRLPIVRMVNINLAPGEGTLADLIADTPRGLLLSTNKSWSIDDVRLDFQFACEAAWEIENGRVGRLLRDPVYQGRTPEFWRGCSAIAGPSDWKMWGYMFCGKGDPMQLMHVGHGVSPARFEDVQLLGGHA